MRMRGRGPVPPDQGRGNGPIPREVKDRIMLRRGVGEKRGEIVHGWVGNWPPPERLLLITHVATGDSRLVDPVLQVPDTLRQFREHPDFHCATYLRNRTVGAVTGVGRRAEYIRERIPDPWLTK